MALLSYRSFSFSLRNCHKFQLVTNFSTSRIGQGTCRDLILNSMKMSPRLINKMIEREQKLLRKNQHSPSKPKNINVTESERSKKFAILFRQKLIDCLYQPVYMEKLKNRVIHFTKIKVPVNFSQVVVNWSTFIPVSGDNESILELEKALDSIASDLRYDIEQIALMGKIPPIIFLRDKNMEVEASFEKLISEIQISNAEPFDEPPLQLDLNMLKKDIFGVNREKALAQIMARVELAKAPHRNPVSKVFELQQDAAES